MGVKLITSNNIGVFLLTISFLLTGCAGTSLVPKEEEESASQTKPVVSESKVLSEENVGDLVEDLDNQDATDGANDNGANTPLGDPDGTADRQNNNDDDENPDGNYPPNADNPDGNDPSDGDYPDGNYPPNDDDPDGNYPPDDDDDWESPDNNYPPNGDKPKGDKPKGDRPDDSDDRDPRHPSKPWDDPDHPGKKKCPRIDPDDLEDHLCGPEHRRHNPRNPKVFVCHKEKVTLCISVRALHAHLGEDGHEDTLGRCENDSDDDDEDDNSDDDDDDNDDDIVF